MKIITVNWNDIKSIKNAEKQKTRLENLGYTFIKSEGGLFHSKLYYHEPQNKMSHKIRRANK